MLRRWLHSIYDLTPVGISVMSSCGHVTPKPVLRGLLSCSLCHIYCLFYYSAAMFFEKKQKFVDWLIYFLSVDDWQMKLNVCAVFLLLLCCLQVDCRLPDFTPAAAPLQVGQVWFWRSLKSPSDCSMRWWLSSAVQERMVSWIISLVLQEKAPVNSNIVTSLKKNDFMRLPGVCRRLKRRRITILVTNLLKSFFSQTFLCVTKIIS